MKFVKILFSRTGKQQRCWKSTLFATLRARSTRIHCRKTPFSYTCVEDENWNFQKCLRRGMVWNLYVRCMKWRLRVGSPSWAQKSFILRIGFDDRSSIISWYGIPCKIWNGGRTYPFCVTFALAFFKSVIAVSWDQSSSVEYSCWEREKTHLYQVTFTSSLEAQSEMFWWRTKTNKTSKISG